MPGASEVEMLANRAEQIDQMRKTLEFAIAVMSRISGPFPEDGTPLTITDQDIARILKEQGLPPLSDRRRILIGQTLIASIEENQISSCAVWDFAHHSMHIIYDTDLPGDGDTKH